jgi:hypothetical protein
VKATPESSWIQWENHFCDVAWGAILQVLLSVSWRLPVFYRWDGCCRELSISRPVSFTKTFSVQYWRSQLLARADETSDDFFYTKGCLSTLVQIERPMWPDWDQSLSQHEVGETQICTQRKAGKYSRKTDLYLIKTGKYNRKACMFITRRQLI